MVIRRLATVLAFAVLNALESSAFVLQSNVGYDSVRLSMAIDYNDPMVAEEFALVQPMEFDDVEAELRAKGIPVPPTLS